MNWDDIRYLLAIGRSGTLSAAARQLKVDQTTVARRLKGAEGDLGVRLFDRIEGRHMPTAQGEMALQRGTRVELEVLALGKRHDRPGCFLERHRAGHRDR